MCLLLAFPLPWKPGSLQHGGRAGREVEGKAFCDSWGVAAVLCSCAAAGALQSDSAGCSACPSSPALPATVRASEVRRWSPAHPIHAA